MFIKPGYKKILLAAFIWGTLGAFARWSGLGPLELSFFRLLLASSSLYAFLPRQQNLGILNDKHYLLMFLSGALFALDSLLFFYALGLTTISNAVLPYNMQPVFVAVLTPVFFRERLETGSIAALFFSLVGLGMIIAPSLAVLSYPDLIGILFSTSGSLCLAFIALMTRLVPIDTLTFVYYKMVAAALMLVPFITFREFFTFQGLSIVVSLGVIHTALAYYLYYDGLKKARIQYAITLTFFVPVIASLTGFFFFDETVTLMTVAGSILIVLNGIYVLFKK